MAPLESNTATYIALLKKCLNNPCGENSYGITHELISEQIPFYPNDIIRGTNAKYVQHELDWYDSQDLCITGHPGIENNPIWQHCASARGLVNSNYGYLIYSDQNGNQFEHAARHLCRNKMSKHAIMVYTRPSIHRDMRNGINANADMICTCYTIDLIRANKLIHIVHMRSNDIYYGLRNDLAWQQEVQKRLLARLKELSPDKFENVVLGNIIWNADSLHIYKDVLPKIKEYINM